MAYGVRCGATDLRGGGSARAQRRLCPRRRGWSLSRARWRCSTPSHPWEPGRPSPANAARRRRGSPPARGRPRRSPRPPPPSPRQASPLPGRGVCRDPPANRRGCASTATEAPPCTWRACPGASSPRAASSRTRPRPLGSAKGAGRWAPNSSASPRTPPGSRPSRTPRSGPSGGRSCAPDGPERAPRRPRAPSCAPCRAGRPERAAPASCHCSHRRGRYPPRIAPIPAHGHAFAPSPTAA